MKKLTAIALLALLAAGCSVSMNDGFSNSESKLIDNNCSGDGAFVNEQWCATLKPSMGPYSASSTASM